MKNHKIKEEQQIEFFNAVTKMSRDQALEYCTNLIKSARAPNYTLMNQLKSMGKDRMMITTNNFIMKGQGNGV
jgi:hypothetical protein